VARRLFHVCLGVAIFSFAYGIDGASTAAQAGTGFTGLIEWPEGSGIEMWALTANGDLYRYNGGFQHIGAFPPSSGEFVAVTNWLEGTGIELWALTTLGELYRYTDAFWLDSLVPGIRNRTVGSH
jgi:hypothetical protein